MQFELGTDGPTSILVGADGSDTSARAGWYAAGLARRQNAKVTVVYVSPTVSLSTSLGAASGTADTVRREGFELIAAEQTQASRLAVDDIHQPDEVHAALIE